MAEPTTTDARIEELIAKDEIRDVLASYFRGVDRRDWDLVRSCYHEDATDRHEPVFDGLATEFIDWVSAWMPTQFDRTWHLGGQSLIDLAGDVANVETYAVAVHRGTPSGHAEPVDLTVGGRLLDRFERRDGKWRIAHRALVDPWTRIDPVGVDAAVSMNLVEGASP